MILTFLCRRKIILKACFGKRIFAADTRYAHRRLLAVVITTAGLRIPGPEDTFRTGQYCVVNGEFESDSMINERNLHVID